MSTTIERPNAPGHDTGSHSLTYAGWRIGLWCGAAYCLLGLIFWAGVAGFLPPPHQSWDAERVKEFFSDDRALVGIVGYCFIAPLWVPMSITLSRIMSRIEGRDGILHRIEFVGGIVTSVISPFAWNGLMTYWVALGLFFVWVPFALVAAFKAIRRLEQEELG